MSVYDGYAKQLDEEALRQHESIDKSTKAQLDALAENKKLVEAEKQNAFRGAYVDYAKNINPYGVQSELAYGSGLGGAGKGETAQANFYNTYQKRLGEIDTAATGQLRDIAQQESAARLAGDQAKLDVTSQANQLKAAAQREDALRAEQYAREDKANAYNQLLTAITGTGYTPTDAELAAAGMTRELANSYRTAYQQSLYSKSAAVKPTYMSAEQMAAAEEYVKNAQNEDEAERYLMVLLGNGYANFDEDMAIGMLNNYWPGITTKNQTQRERAKGWA